MSMTPSDPDQPVGGEVSEDALRHGEEVDEMPESGPAVGDELGDGAPRYGEDVDEIPASGSEESWSAQPHPGFEPRPAGPGTNQRLAAGLLVGALFLAGGVWVGYAVLTAKSPNGNGAASWTAAVTENGAVVQGINAQNNVGGNSAAVGESGQEIQAATATCDAATGNSKQLTTTTGTVAGIGEWAIKATPSVDEFKADAAKLGIAVNADDIAGIATAAQGFCTAFGKITELPAMPDAAGSAAWAGAITAYADAANHALKGASGDQSALMKAKDDLAHGDAEMDALSARIIAAT